MSKEASIGRFFIRLNEMPESLKLSELEFILDELYQPFEFKDYCSSGLLIQGKENLKKGCTAISFSLPVVEQAVKRKADFLIVHHPHGLWNNQTRRIKGGLWKKINMMIKHNIGLFAYHLPMDAHTQLGNNINLLKVLGLKQVGEFSPHGKYSLGLVGEFEKSLSFSHFTKIVEERIGPINFQFGFGKKTIKRVALSSGGAAGMAMDAMKTGAQVFLTGEAREDTFVFCQDEKFNFLACGHNRTEVFGPKSLAEYMNAEKIIRTEFIKLEGPI